MLSNRAREPITWQDENKFKKQIMYSLVKVKEIQGGQGSEFQAGKWVPFCSREPLIAEGWSQLAANFSPLDVSKALRYSSIGVLPPW
jgi:hypothetical protein